MLVLVIRVMTVATVLMLVACLMIGATLALAHPSRTEARHHLPASLQESSLSHQASTIR